MNFKTKTRKPKPLEVSINTERDTVMISNFTLDDLARFNSRISRTIEALIHVNSFEDKMRYYLIKSVAEKGIRRYSNHCKSVTITIPEAIAFHAQFQHEIYLTHIVHTIACLIDQRLK